MCSCDISPLRSYDARMVALEREIMEFDTENGEYALVCDVSVSLMRGYRRGGGGEKKERKKILLKALSFISCRGLAPRVWTYRHQIFLRRNIDGPLCLF